ncbi:putative membrane protein YedE/YeeE [Achromobacter deleyi]|uniref:hypothetical protein n=1 Tax=Achromobacter deleyi TaxID=1353891 RepID=UPI002864D669|nr:hypothetical protein [Achromobacter deleyi]MDR6599030.1 putative membrane protein YedE/YeeE [Achromobacter deleyi]
MAAASGLRLRVTMAMIMGVVMLVAVIMIMIMVMVVAVIVAVIVVVAMIVPVAPVDRCVIVTRLAVRRFAVPGAAAGAVLPGGLGFVGVDRREGHLLRLM